MPGGADGLQGADEREPANTVAEELVTGQAAAALEEEERATWKAREDAVKALEEAGAKAWEDAVAQSGAEDSMWLAWEAGSPPLSSPSEHRLKWVHDPAFRAEADERAATEVADRNAEGSSEPASG